MKTSKRILAGVLAVASTLSLVACGNDAESSSYTATLNSEQEQIVEEVAMTLPERELENTNIKWLSFYDLNPANGRVKTAELQLFEEKYNGTIEYVQTTWATKYTDLANYVISQNSPDFFPADDMDAFPKGAIKNMFQPVDPYIDYTQPTGKR